MRMPGRSVAPLPRAELDPPAQRPPRGEFLATGRARLQMPDDLVRRLDEELIAQERIGELARFAAGHGHRAPFAADAMPRCVSDVRSSSRPRCSRDMTVP